MNQPLNYESYLKLDILLSAQKPLSVEKNRPAHDEMLFISTHHAYEIWFKQMIYELDSVLNIFAQKNIDEKLMETIVSRLNRMNQILKVLISQIDILATMTPMDFLEFRDLIYSASGFQSFQFRLIENKLGLRPGDRLPFHQKPYHVELHPQQAKQVVAAENDTNLFDGLDEWLSRTPFLDTKNFKFWEEYKSAANIMFQHDEKFIQNNVYLNTVEKEKLSANIEQQKLSFAGLFDEQKYLEDQKKGLWRLSYKAIHAALLIQLYREQPVFQLPFRLLTEVIDLDSHLTEWRYRHTLLVRRMVGMRMGTGGSTGADYLQKSTEQHKVFGDLLKLVTYFVPRSARPALPEGFEKMLGFAYQKSTT